jgi:hypothetical protein
MTINATTTATIRPVRLYHGCAERSRQKENAERGDECFSPQTNSNIFTNGAEPSNWVYDIVGMSFIFDEFKEGTSDFDFL